MTHPRWKTWALAGVLALPACGASQCDKPADGPSAGAPPPAAEVAATVAGCDPDALAAMSCFVYPISTQQEVLLRATGSAKAAAEKLRARSVGRIRISEGETELTVLRLDPQGRLVEEREGQTVRAIAYDDEGRVTTIRIENDGKLFLEKLVMRPVEGNGCNVTTTFGTPPPGGSATESVRCSVEGDMLYRVGPFGSVNASIRAERVEYSTGSYVVTDSLGRTTERKDGAGLTRFEYGEQGVSELRDTPEGARVLNVVEVDADGLPTRQVFPAAQGYPDKVITWTYDQR